MPAGDQTHPKNALLHLDTIQKQIKGKQPVMFLDYDGTLTPIVDVPSKAYISPEMRQVVSDLSSTFVTSIVSGRSTEKLLDFIGKQDSLIFAGSHGFDIKGPFEMPCVMGPDFCSLLITIGESLKAGLASISGVGIENNKFSLSVHYRHVSPELHSQVEAVVDDHISQHPSKLVKKHGKKVFELRPSINWDKGAAVLWILNAIKSANNSREDLIPLYIGDDVSDEDAFTALLQEGGIGIVVRDPKNDLNELPGSETTFPVTAASYALTNPAQVLEFLKTLTRTETEKTTTHCF